MSEIAPTVAGNWPRGKLAIALGVAVALHLMTFWNLDLAARQQAENLRGEAGALALSVAPPRIADSENAAILYEQAEEGLLPLSRPRSGRRSTSWETRPSRGSIPRTPSCAVCFRRYAAVLALLREAASKPNCYFERDYSWPTIDDDAAGSADTFGWPPCCWTSTLAHKPPTATLGRPSRTSMRCSPCRGTSGRIRSWSACCVSFHIEQKATAALQNLLLSNKLSADDLATLRIPPILLIKG